MLVANGGEIISNVAGFWESEEVDSAKFIKLFVNGVKAFAELSNAGARILNCSTLKCKTTSAKIKFI